MNKIYPKIFVVDDDYSIRFTLESILSPKGFKIRTFEKVDDCIQQIQIDAPDLFILDLEMPEKNGFDLLQYINSQEKFCNIPVLVLSSLNDMKSVKKVSSLNVKHYALKPLDYHYFMQKISSLLGVPLETEILVNEEAIVSCEAQISCVSEIDMEVVGPFKPAFNQLLNIKGELFDDLSLGELTVLSANSPSFMEEKGFFRSAYYIQVVPIRFVEWLKGQFRGVSNG